MSCIYIYDQQQEHEVLLEVGIYRRCKFFLHFHLDEFWCNSLTVSYNYIGTKYLDLDSNLMITKITMVV